MIERIVYFEDYQIGDFRESVGRTITETDVVLHAGQTGDFFPHHMDVEFAKTTPFGERIAHGTLIFSIGVGMTATLINPVAFSYGYDRLRFIRPVFIGETIRVKTALKEKRDNPKDPKKGFVVEALEVFNQRDELVLVCEHLLSCQKK